MDNLLVSFALLSDYIVLVSSGEKGKEFLSLRLSVFPSSTFSQYSLVCLFSKLSGWGIMFCFSFVLSLWGRVLYFFFFLNSATFYPGVKCAWMCTMTHQVHSETKHIVACIPPSVCHVHLWIIDIKNIPHV